jgi:hypothetical protein
MLATKKIAMRLSTTIEADRRAPLEDFAKACTALQRCLAGVARCLGREYIATPISNLAYRSALIEVTTDSDVAETFDNTVAAFEEGRTIDERLDYPTLRSFRRFAVTAGKPGLELELGHRRLSSHYVSNVSAALKSSSPELGSVSGRLEAFNVHSRPSFTLYPPVPHERIECRFRTRQLKRVLKAVTRHVTVFGTLRYRRGKAFPCHVAVDDFVVNPNDDELPTLLEPRGDKPSSPVTRPPELDGADDWE